MATKRQLNPGSSWSSSELHDGWGDCGEGNNEQACIEMLGNAVVARFHEIAEANESNAYWTPYTSQIIVDVDDKFDIDDFEEWKQQATSKIWQAWLDGDIKPILL